MCVFFYPNGPDQEKRGEEIEATFTPWHKDPIRIARLYRWLELMDRPPIDAAAFIECAISWDCDYQDMKLWEGPK